MTPVPKISNEDYRRLLIHYILILQTKNPFTREELESLPNGVLEGILDRI